MVINIGHTSGETVAGIEVYSHDHLPSPDNVIPHPKMGKDGSGRAHPTLSPHPIMVSHCYASPRFSDPVLALTYSSMYKYIYKLINYNDTTNGSSSTLWHCQQCKLRGLIG